jgi:dTDP-4-dehydrorhamnose 3,5-epimerase
MIDQARRAPQTVTSDWMPLGGPAIDGVQIKEIRNVTVRSGVLTECFRPEWFTPPFPAAHVVHMALLPGGLSSWHCHREQSDVIVPILGQLRIGVYDDREDSPTYKAFRLLHVSAARPVAIRVPPLVWHAIKNPTGESAAYIVINDQPYHYAEPDDWILPPGSDAIPFTLD